MDLEKALYYAAIAFGLLIAVSVVVSVVSTLLSLVGAVVSGAVSLAVLLGIAYLVYRAGSWAFGGGRDSTTDGLERSRSSASLPGGADEAESRKERLRRQYVEGQISEEEFERRIARELESEDIDAELERER